MFGFFKGAIRGLVKGFGIVVVDGDSMEPTYRHGDRLLVHWRDKPEGKLYAHPGNAVVIERDQQPGIFYIKRISEISADTSGDISVFLLSDNSLGTDSRQWGLLKSSEIKARCICRVRGGN